MREGVNEGRLAEFEAEAESQLVLLDLSVSVDVAVTHQGLPELVQVCAADAGLEEGQHRGQRSNTASLLMDTRTLLHSQVNCSSSDP